MAEEKKMPNERGRKDDSALEEQKFFDATLNLVDLAGSESFTTNLGNATTGNEVNKQSLSALKVLLLHIKKRLHTV